MQKYDVMSSFVIVFVYRYWPELAAFWFVNEFLAKNLKQKRKLFDMCIINLM